MRYFVMILSIVASAACSSRPVTPDSDSVRVSREEPRADCHEMGKLTGTTRSSQGKPEAALADLKKEATNRGANYVRIFEYSGMGTAVTGMAYNCP